MTSSVRVQEPDVMGGAGLLLEAQFSQGEWEPGAEDEGRQHRRLSVIRPEGISASVASVTRGLLPGWGSPPQLRAPCFGWGPAGAMSSGVVQQGAGQSLCPGPSAAPPPKPGGGIKGPNQGGFSKRGFRDFDSRLLPEI